MDCIHIVGNRPQFIKLALLHKAIGEQTSFHQKIIHTGQHYDAVMSDIFFSELSIARPDFQLAINQLPHYAQIGRMTEEIGNILATEGSATGVIVYGDTNTTLAGALAAKKNGLPVAHVESGIRTGDELMPEESNRYLTDRIAEINFCPTDLCVKNLLEEGFGKMSYKKTVNTGDIMLDAWKHARNLDTTATNLPTPAFVLATIHREENNSSIEKLTEIVKALNIINSSIPVVMPCHPGTRTKINATGIPICFDLRTPFSYLEMNAALKASTYVITDSGGLCREAFFSHKPALAIMTHSFWPEILSTGTCLHTQAVTDNILSNFASLENVEPKFEVSIFGEGDAATLMTNILQEAWA